MQLSRENYDKNLPNAVKAMNFTGTKLVKGKNKIDKIPCDSNGKFVNSTQDKHWVDFSTAQHWLSQGWSYGHTLVMADSEVCCVDLDGHREDALATSVIGAFNSYTELSHSGNGVHILCKYDPEKLHGVNKRYKKLGIDILTGQVFLTGNCIENAGVLEDCTEQLEKLINWCKAKTNHLSPAEKKCNTGLQLDDDVIIKNIYRAKNAHQTIALYEGRVKPEGNVSASQLDFALARTLAFWCGDNVDQIQRIMTNSGLKRDKWNRYDYLRVTIENALNTQTVFYGRK